MGYLEAIRAWIFDDNPLWFWVCIVLLLLLIFYPKNTVIEINFKKGECLEWSYKDKIIYGGVVSFNFETNKFVPGISIMQIQEIDKCKKWDLKELN